MGPALLLLVLALSHFSRPARGDLLDVFDDFVDALYDYANNTTEEIETEAASEFHLSWLLELFDEPNGCDPNPCMNEGTCKPKYTGGYTCSCVQSYSGKNCEKFVNPCKKVNCGAGECVLTNTAPFYECKCRPPFQPPHCKKAAACRPNPCLNGGTCQKGKTRSQFTCLCPSAYSGKLCQVGPGDCYSGDGESYRGFVSETEDGQDCLPWNSHLVPYSQYEHDGLGPHSYCRNPDGDFGPWCFVKVKKKLQWEFCNVTECGENTALPTVPVTPEIGGPESSQEPPTQQFATCGRPQPGRALGRVFGGNKAMPAAHPWQVSLQVRINDTEEFLHRCGGILIDSCWILTAAHCLKFQMRAEYDCRCCWNCWN